MNIIDRVGANKFETFIDVNIDQLCSNFNSLRDKRNPTTRHVLFIGVCGENGFRKQNVLFIYFFLFFVLQAY